MNRRLIHRSRLLVLVVICALALGNWSPALAVTYPLAEGTIDLGRQGLFVSKPGRAGIEMELVREKMFASPTGVSLRAVGVSIQFVDSRNHEIPPEGLVYLFFNLTEQERTVYDLYPYSFAIWYWAPNEQDVEVWTPCPATLFVEKGLYGRLACVIPRNAIYYLGSTALNYEIFQ
jgi:hypothetical protein